MIALFYSAGFGIAMFGRVADEGTQFYWTSKRGSDRVGASRSRSAACASDCRIARLVQPLRASLRRPLARLRGAPTRALPRFNSNFPWLCTSLSRVSCLGFVGRIFAKKNISQGCSCWAPTGAPNKSDRDRHAVGLASVTNKRALEPNFGISEMPTDERTLDAALLVL